MLMSIEHNRIKHLDHLYGMRNVLFLLCMFFAMHLSAQIRGTVKDVSGQVLPYAHIYVEGTSSGTSANAEGYYELYLDPGTYQIIVEYLGYQSERRTIVLTQAPYDHSVVLTSEQISLDEVVIAADAEDPAYRIMREVIARRGDFLDAMSPYTTDVYIKGNISLTDAPEKMFGQEVGDMAGILDSNRQGILYLSETASTYHYVSSSVNKEIIHSSIVSGEDQGVSFNRAIYTDFNIYDNLIELQRDIVSPVADGAMAYYRYSLLGSTFLEDKKIYKIQVISKRPENPTCAGVIYIYDEDYAVKNVDLYVTSKAVNSAIIDTMRIRQNYAYIPQLSAWHRMDQQLIFGMGLMGFNAEGIFTSIYNNYRDLDPATLQGDREAVRIEADAIKSEDVHWKDIRPIPLLDTEVKDYVKKDSLRRLWESKPYLDSLDKKNNRFVPIHLIAGYSYSNSYEKNGWNIRAPLEAAQYNTVQGVNIGLELDFYKYRDDGYRRVISPRLEYGFSDKKFRGSLEFYLRKDRKRYGRLQAGIGREVFQFNRAEPVDEQFNTFSSLLYKVNLWRVYEAEFIYANYFRVLAPSWRGSIGLRYEDRSELKSTTDWSIGRKDETFEPNVMDHPAVDQGSLDLPGTRAVTARAVLGWLPEESFETLPDRIRYLGSDWPRVTLAVRAHYYPEIDVELGDALALNYSLTLSGRVGFGLVGDGRYFGRYADFLGDTPRSFVDYHHFLGTKSKFTRFRNVAHFYALPFYAYSTSSQAFDIHYQHSFNGFIADKIPLLRKLKWTFGAGAAALSTRERGDYGEINFGLRDVGFSVFRIFEIDAVYSQGDQAEGGWTYRVGVKEAF